MRYRKKKIAGRTVYEHRLVVAEALGPLRSDEHVHHKNDDGLDNRLENLEIKSPRDHARHHLLTRPITKLCGICGSSFRPPPSHRARDKTCSPDCRRALICLSRLGDQASDLDVQEIRFAYAVGESLRSIGRRYGIHHHSVKRMVNWPPALAEAVARSVLAREEG